MSDLKKLSAPFPQSAISWRAQNVTKNGDKALALAYIDARDVMERLDDVCGVEGWQCDYPHANGKTICSIGIKCGDEWVWKADGAGDTDVEAEKGAISDAFKRAAVKWGIGRYLYDDAFKNVWVPCESYDGKDGKKKFSKFIADPWNFVKGQPQAKPDIELYLTGIRQAKDLEALKVAFSSGRKEFYGDSISIDKLVEAKDKRKSEIEEEGKKAA